MTTIPAVSNGPYIVNNWHHKDTDKTRRKDSCSKTKNRELKIFLPMGPIQWIVGIFRRLGSKNEIFVRPFAMLQALSHCFGMGFFLVEEDCSGDVGELMV